MASSSPTNSDPVLVDHSTADISDPSNETSNNEIPERPPPLSRASTSALEKCWICLSTKEEDPPSPPNPPTVWRTPCACTLQAHESCLLDWIADQEAPRSRSGGRSGPTPDKIFCPQCRSEIKVQRSVDPLVNLCRRVDKTYSRFVLPGLATALTGTIFSGFYIHGRLAVYLVCGSAHSQWLYLSTLRHPSRALSYCLVPLNLIFARTRFADFVLPSGTLFLLSTQLEDGFAFDWTLWPPLPSTAFALLPAVRQSYNWLYEQAFGELNRKWIKEVQPRREEGYEGQEGNIADILNEHEAELAEAEAEAAAGGGDVLLELEVNLGALEDGADNDAPIPGGDDQDAANLQNDNGEGDGNGGGGGRVHQLLGDNEFMDDTSSIGQLVIGSLLMPAVASAAGDLLNLVLPTTWTSPFVNFSSSSRRPGLLASKWGRSLIGGLAFVAVKDMLVLYCRWRLAEGHKKRRVMNYDKIEKKYVAVQ